MTTLRRERRTKFEEEIQSSQLHYYARLYLEHAGNTPEYVDNTLAQCREDLAALLADAAESRSEKAEPEPNVELMRGDYREYPEHLWTYALKLRDTWKMSLPSKPKKGTKNSKYRFFFLGLEDLKFACAEFGADVLDKVYSDWRAKFREGVAPYTIAGPESLVKVCTAKAMELRQTPVINAPATYIPEDDSKFVPAPVEK